MDEQSHVKLTSAELSNLWTSFQTDSMILCGVRYFLTHIEDEELRQVSETVMNNVQTRLEEITRLFNKENYPVPVGFTDNDVHLSAPRLFSDKLILLYLMNMGKFSLTGYSLAFSLSSREDITNFYSKCLSQGKALVENTRQLALAKGIYVRPPYIPTPNQVDFVKKQSFLSGWLNRRPLLGVEIANLVYNAERNALGEALIVGFSQVANDKKVRQYLVRGREIAAKHLEVFSSKLNAEHLSSAMNLTSEVSDSTVPPFSDKLMMFHISALVASGIGQYGAAMSTSPRRDLGTVYTRLMAEIAAYSEDGANLLIDNGWMEQPPMAADRDGLAKNKE